MAYSPGEGPVPYVHLCLILAVARTARSRPSQLAGSPTRPSLFRATIPRRAYHTNAALVACRAEAFPLYVRGASASSLEGEEAALTLLPPPLSPSLQTSECRTLPQSRGSSTSCVSLSLWLSLLSRAFSVQSALQLTFSNAPSLFLASHLLLRPLARAQVVAFTFPRLLSAFTPTGAFGWYAACASSSRSFPPRAPFCRALRRLACRLVADPSISSSRARQGTLPGPSSSSVRLAPARSSHPPCADSRPTSPRPRDQRPLSRGARRRLQHSDGSSHRLQRRRPQVRRPLLPLSSFSLALALTLSHPARSYNFRKYILRQRLPPREPLYAWEGKGQA